jgi:hypothetical protein
MPGTRNSRECVKVGRASISGVRTTHDAGHPARRRHPYLRDHLGSVLTGPHFRFSIPPMNIAPAVTDAETGSGAGEPKEQQDEHGDQTSDRNVFAGAVSAYAAVGRRLNGRTRLVFRLTRMRRRLLSGQTGKGCTTIRTELGPIRIRQSTIWAMHRIGYSIRLLAYRSIIVGLSIYHVSSGPLSVNSI